MTSKDIGTCERESSIRSRLAWKIIALSGVSLLCAAQEIKKKTELMFPRDGIALQVAEARTEHGAGHGTAWSIVKGMAAATNTPTPNDDPSADLDYDPNYDYTKYLYLAAGTRCHADTTDRVTVLGKD